MSDNTGAVLSASNSNDSKQHSLELFTPSNSTTASGVVSESGRDCTSSSVGILNTAYVQYSSSGGDQAPQNAGSSLSSVCSPVRNVNDQSDWKSRMSINPVPFPFSGQDFIPLLTDEHNDSDSMPSESFHSDSAGGNSHSNTTIGTEVPEGVRDENLMLQVCSDNVSESTIETETSGSNSECLDLSADIGSDYDSDQASNRVYATKRKTTRTRELSSSKSPPTKKLRTTETRRTIRKRLSLHFVAKLRSTKKRAMRLRHRRNAKGKACVVSKSCTGKNKSKSTHMSR